MSSTSRDRLRRPILRGAPVLFLALLCGSSFGQDDVAALLKSKEPRDRVEAIRKLEENGGADAAVTLQKALADKDFEVVACAVKALAKHGTPAQANALIDVALEFPLRATRLAAAEALHAVAPAAAAAKTLAGKLKGTTRIATAEALAIVADPGSAKTLEKLLTAEEPEVRVAAVKGLARIGGADSHEKLVKQLTTGTPVATAAAAAALADAATRAGFDALLAKLETATLSDVIERRVREATVRVLVALSGEDRGSALNAVSTAFARKGSARLARLLGDFGTSSAAGATAAFHTDAPACAEILLAKGIVHGDAVTRRASVVALGRLQSAAAFDALAKLLKDDDNPSCRALAIEALARIDETKARDPIRAAMTGDGEVAVREQAAVVCGKRHWVDTAPSLREALADKDWRVRLAAAISLGSIQDAEAIAPLVAMTTEKDDWKSRATAAAGLGRIGRGEAIPPLIQLLRDPDAMVKATAHEYLKRLSFQELPPDASRWEKWWKDSSTKFAFVDRNVKFRETNDGKYAFDDFKKDPYAVLRDIGVFVLGGGKDALEQHFTKLTIGHTMTLPGKVNESGLHPHALFVSNCPGSIQGEDGDRLDWFVRSGGYLLGTCWALTNTVAKTFPGVVHADRDQSDPGSIDAEPGNRASPFLKDVVEPSTRLWFRLAGYQIITIDDKERFDVLVDSIEADDKWGQGILCGWFPVGHGVVMQSTNHFALQGMTGQNFDSERDRMAFALERLGYGYAAVRELQKDGAFKSDRTAAEKCDDQTFLRLISRIVHEKRKLDG